MRQIDLAQALLDLATELLTGEKSRKGKKPKHPEPLDHPVKHRTPRLKHDPLVKLPHPPKLPGED